MLRLLKLVAYVLDRLSEPSTWAGLVLVFGSGGLALLGIEPGHAAFIAGIFAGAVHAAFPDVPDHRHDE